MAAILKPPRAFALTQRPNENYESAAQFIESLSALAVTYVIVSSPVKFLLKKG